MAFTGFVRRDHRKNATANIDQFGRGGGGLINSARQRGPPNPGLQRRGRGHEARQNDENYSDTTTHEPDGERPKKRLSYIGWIWVAGQMKVPAAVARASTL